MALRVLLADNSETIKRVIQLALEEFGVEVRSVSIGLDVLNVARAFKPDLIFVDILLQKKNGYVVTSELKADKELKSVPVILMWSGFMELDEVRADECGAEARLEKPFDSDRLRAVVQKALPGAGGESSEPIPTNEPTVAAEKTELGLPALPTFGSSSETSSGDDEGDVPVRGAAANPHANEPTVAEPLNPLESTSWNMDSFEEIPHVELPDLELSPQSTPKGGPSIPEIEIELEGANGPDEVEQFESRSLSPKKTASPATEGVALGDMGGDEPEEFSSVDLGWEKKSLSQYKLEKNSKPAPMDDLNPVDEANTEMMDRISSQKINPQNVVKQSAVAKVGSGAKSGAGPAGASASPTLTLTRDELEELVREQSRQIVQEAVWKLVPDIATDLIKKEIRRLLDESP